MGDSDVTYRYGNIVARGSNKAADPIGSGGAATDWANRKNVAWIVSHCNPLRRFYAEELAKHIDVSIYGKCGNMSCPRKGQRCQRDIQSQYKFYLAFENSLCEDYVTEKLFKTLETSMIPIVYGMYNYRKYLPSNSFIDVQDFKSPKHLADYLHVLSANKTLFDSYMTWKRDFKVQQDSIPTMF